MELKNLTVDEVWQKVEKLTKANPKPIEGMNATFSFDIVGDNGSSYGLKFQDGEAEVVEGGIEDAECTLTMNEKNFKKLLQGDLNSTTAFMTGKLKVKGNIGLALKLESILKKYSF